MKICWFGIYDTDYPRNSILINGLRANGVEVVECFTDWRDKHRYIHLWKKLRDLKGDYDVIYAAYPATVPTILTKVLSRKVVVMDAFYSMYDTVVNDRREIKWYHPRALKLLLLDWLSVLCADYIVTDTDGHKKYWSKWLFVKDKKIFPIYLGVEDDVYYPMESKRKDNFFLVHFHGHYIPVQGVSKIVEAAKILKNDPSIRFRLVGTGQESKKILKQIEDNNLKNIEQIDRMFPKKAKYGLNVFMSEADVILGIFGDPIRARRVIPNKVYEGLAARKPVITMDCEGVREIFTDNDLYLIKNDSESLARAIKILQADSILRMKLAVNGYNKVMQKYTPKPLGAELKKLFEYFVK